jgi:glutamate racemase
MRKIGVFDSGVGGKSVANALAKGLPDCEIVFKNDVVNIPYGNKSSDQVFGFVLPILQALADEGCEMIVIACNTVSTTIIDQLREKITVPLIPVEPMIKTAAETTKTKVIAVCATPATLASPRYAQLKRDYAEDLEVIEPDCSDWSYLIENKQINREHIDENILPALARSADVVVLGCTHYHWIEEEIKAIVGDEVAILQPEQTILEEVTKLLAKHAPQI